MGEAWGDALSWVWEPWARCGCVRVGGNESDREVPDAERLCLKLPSFKYFRFAPRQVCAGKRHTHWEMFLLGPACRGKGGSGRPSRRKGTVGERLSPPLPRPSTPPPSQTNAPWVEFKHLTWRDRAPLLFGDPHSSRQGFFFSGEIPIPHVGQMAVTRPEGA